MVTKQQIPAFWSLQVEDVLRHVETTRQGLTSHEAAERRTQFASCRLKARHKTHPLTILAAQFRNPIILILISAALVSCA